MCQDSHLNNNSNGYLNKLPYSESSSIHQKNLLKTNFTDTALIDFAIPQAITTIQPPTQSNLSIQQDLQINGCNFFHYTSGDDKFYHITCKKILQDSISLDDHDHDHAFFYQCSNDSSNYYVTCKLLSHALIVNILNR